MGSVVVAHGLCCPEVCGIFLDQEDLLEEEMATHCQYSCLENSMDREAWWATIHRVIESDTTEAT